MIDGRLVTEYEPWITSDMYLHPPIGQVTEQFFTAMRRSGKQLYVIEHDGEPMVTFVFSVPPDVRIILGECYWVRPDQRLAKSGLIDQLMEEIAEVTGIRVIVSQISPAYAKANEHRTIEGTRERAKTLGRDVLYHDSIYVIAQGVYDV